MRANYLTNLPEELIVYVLSFLSPVDLYQLIFVNKHLRRISLDRILLRGRFLDLADRCTLSCMIKSYNHFTEILANRTANNATPKLEVEKFEISLLAILVYMYRSCEIDGVLDRCSTALHDSQKNALKILMECDSEYGNEDIEKIWSAFSTVKKNEEGESSILNGFEMLARIVFSQMMGYSNIDAEYFNPEGYLRSFYQNRLWNNNCYFYANRDEDYQPNVEEGDDPEDGTYFYWELIFCQGSFENHYKKASLSLPIKIFNIFLNKVYNGNYRGNNKTLIQLLLIAGASAFSICSTEEYPEEPNLIVAYREYAYLMANIRSPKHLEMFKSRVHSAIDYAVSEKNAELLKTVMDEFQTYCSYDIFFITDIIKKVIQTKNTNLSMQEDEEQSFFQVQYLLGIFPGALNGYLYTKNSETPLVWAAQNDRHLVAQFLINEGANVESYSCQNKLHIQYGLDAESLVGFFNPMLRFLFLYEMLKRDLSGTVDMPKFETISRELRCRIEPIAYEVESTDLLSMSKIMLDVYVQTFASPISSVDEYVGMHQSRLFASKSKGEWSDSDDESSTDNQSATGLKSHSTSSSAADSD